MTAVLTLSLTAKIVGGIIGILLFLILGVASYALRNITLANKHEKDD